MCACGVCGCDDIPGTEDRAGNKRNNPALENLRIREEKIRPKPNSCDMKRNAAGKTTAFERAREGGGEGVRAISNKAARDGQSH